ncbi:hypothetical protein RhiirC2_871503 [Rhizophagus irregularis]|uniref:Uncharacterized protein n=1 Tax=Rhizophagus irregularis TaxID=588596 RepID=A0A2N1MAF6_9GLOM|nr:hypothetical protein RhiirC2_871503 [Rhizophagus irregularis]
MSMDKRRTPNGAAIDFVSEFQDIFFETISQHLGTFIQDGFLKDLYDKKPTTPVDKAQMLIDRFGESANPQKFIEQARSLNIQPTTLSLIFSIALSAASRSWDNFTTHFYMEFGDMGDEKAQRKLKTKNTPDTKKSGKTGKAPVGNKSKKKDNIPSSSSNKTKDNQLKDPPAQKKAKNTSNSKDRDKGNQVVLAEILSLLHRLV